MAEPLKLGFIGGGINSAVGHVHKIASEMDNQFSLVSGCFSRDSKINNATAVEYGVEQNRVYSSIDELLTEEKDQLDAVVILTPTPNHYSDVLKCIHQNMPVICEKALTNSSKNAKQILSNIVQNDGFLAVTFNYTGYPMLRELKHLIEQNQFGNITQIHIEMPQEGFARKNNDGEPVIPQSWRLKDTDIPTLSLDLGVHVHHLVDFLIGESAQHVIAVQNNLGPFEGIIDDTHCLVKYSNNVMCNFWFSKVALGHRNGLRVRVFGDNGSAEWFQLKPEDLVLYDTHGHRSIRDRSDSHSKVASQARYNRFKAGHPTGFIEAFANHYYDIASALSAYKRHSPITNEYVFSAENALSGLSFLEAVNVSHQTQQWQNIK